MFNKRLDHKIAIGAVVVVFLLCVASGVTFAYKKIQNNREKYAASEQPVEIEKTETKTKPKTNPPKEEAIENIKKDPPKVESTSGQITGSTVENSDGSKTTTVTSNGSVDTNASTDSDYSYLEDAVRGYLNSGILRTGSEKSSLQKIIVKDAGDTGWAGQWAGSYTIMPSGDITSATGWITLNVYYYKNSPYLEDYMKLVFSHEYGHHYTQYHKWVDWDLEAGTRFPDSYYSVRPLSKATTAVDYSLGWGNCDAEIIAEDYSYIYSGYGYHAMSNTYGYPSASTKTWLDNIASGPGGDLPTEPETDDPPTVSIKSPASGATLSGSINFEATASDDIGVTKVRFYVDSTLVNEDNSSPYKMTLDTTKYSNGAHSLKAVAYDQSQNTQKSINVTFDNALESPPEDDENPTVNITDPSANPYSWTSSVSNLVIKVRSSDNVGVTLLKFYVNGESEGEISAESVDVSWLYSSAPAGQYVFKVEAYDGAGNMGETTLTINKN